MDLKFKVMMIVGRPVHEVFEAVADPKDHVLVVSESGYGKRSEVEEYRFQSRGGSCSPPTVILRTPRPAVGSAHVGAACGEPVPAVRRVGDRPARPPGSGWSAPAPS